jgi:hypothetical protein
MEKIRKNIIKFLEKGKIPDYKYLNYYKQLKNYQFQKNDFLQKNIDTLKNYYPNATEDEKAIINNVIFILEIFNSQKNALEDYLFRTLHFNWKLLKSAEAFTCAMEFFQKNTFALPQNIFIKVLNKILEPIYYFSLNESRRKSILINILVIWENKNILVQPFWLNQLLTFKKIIDFAIKRDYIEDAMYSEFFIYHFYGNTAQTIKDWENFNNLIEKPLSKYFKKWGEKNNLPQPKNYKNKKKKLGFLIDRLVLTSPLMVEYSLWKNLIENEEFKKNYEIYVYSMNYAEKQLENGKWIEKLKQLGINFYSPQYKFIDDKPYYNHLEKAMDLRNKMLEDKIDVLIGGFGYAISNFLFSTRTAPKQIFWSHGNCTSEIENIDLRISHFSQECKNYEWKIFNIPIAEEFLIGSEKDKIQGQRIKEKLLTKYGKNTVILGTIGRLIKIDSDEYIKTIAKIMEQNPNTIYLACGEGNKESIKEKLKKYKIDEKRFIFTGMIEPHVYGWVIDIWPDTFPLIQGQSKNEFIAKKGCTILYQPACKINSKNYNYFFESINFSPLANNLNEYINKLNIVIKNTNLRKKIGEIQYSIKMKERINLNQILNITK